MDEFTIREAAALLGVSDDTVRRWGDSGRLAVHKGENGRQAISGKDLLPLLQEPERVACEHGVMLTRPIVAALPGVAIEHDPSADLLGALEEPVHLYRRDRAAFINYPDLIREAIGLTLQE